MACGADVQVLTVAGRRFVLLPESDYRRLQEAAASGEPALPPADAQGNYPAVATLRALLARDLLRERHTLGLTQAELARRAGIRAETLNRLEQGKHSPSVRTVDKIDRALRAAGAERRTAKSAAGRRSRAKRKPQSRGRR